MLLLVLTLLVAVPPIIAAGLLLIQSVLLWNRRRVLRNELPTAVEVAVAYLAASSETHFATERDRREWRFGAEGDLHHIWWQSPFDYTTIDDYISDVQVQASIDSLARKVAAQREPA